MKALLNLFVDDGRMAALILVWIGVCGALALGPILFFLGLGSILAQSVLTAKRPPKL